MIVALLAFAPKTQAAFGDTTTTVSQLYAGDGGSALDAFFDFPEDLFISGDGTIWVADTFNNVIRAIAPNEIVSTYAGTGAYGLANGAAGSARFGQPQGIAVSSSGVVYVSDTANDALRQIDANGSVSTLLSTLNQPQGLALGIDFLYIADTGSNAIKVYSLSAKTLTTLTTAIKAPRKIVLTPDGSALYAVDNGNYRVVRISTSDGSITVVAGSGTKGYLEGVGTAAQFYDPAGIGLDPATNTLYVGDIDSLRFAMIRKINLTTGETTQWVYDSAMTSVNERSSMRVYNGYLYLAGTGNIHRYNLNNPADNSDVGGKNRYQLREGALSQALLARPVKLAFSKDRKSLYVAGGHKVLKIDRTAGSLSFLLGNSVDNYVEAQGSTVRFSGVSGMAVNAANDTLYVVDRFNNRIRGVNLATNTSFLISGIGLTNTTGPANGYADGAKDTAKFSNPVDLVLTPDETAMYVSDAGNHVIRRVEIATGQTSLVAGSPGNAGFADGQGSAAKFDSPFGLAMDAAGKYLYVADRNNHRIRRVTLANGTVATIAGSGHAGYREAVGASAVFNLPTYLALDSDRLYVSDSGSHHIRVIELGSKVTKLVAGSGQRGYQNGGRTVAQFNNIGGLLVDASTESLLVGDTWNDVIRSINVSGVVPFTDPAPIAAAVVPRQVKKVGAEAHIDIRGSGFQHGVVVKFGNTAIRSFVESSKKLAIIVPISKMALGWYDVRVTNLDGQSDTLVAGFGLAGSNNEVPAVFHSLPTGNGFIAFPSGAQSGVQAIGADINGDGQDDLITTQPGSSVPLIRILSPSGKLIRQFRAFPKTVDGGITVAAGNLIGDATPELLAAAQTGVVELRILTPSGRVLKSIYPFGKKAKFGATLAIGDVDGDGLPEIIVGAADGSTQVVIMNAAGKVIRVFTAYARSKAGVSVASVDLNGDGVAEILTIPRRGSTLVKVFQANGTMIRQGYAFARSLKIGGNLAVGDVSGDGTLEVIVGLRTGGTPTVRVLSPLLKLISEFSAYPSAYRGGVNVAVGRVTDDGIGKIITSRMQGLPEVIFFTAAGRSILAQ